MKLPLGITTLILLLSITYSVRGQDTLLIFHPTNYNLELVQKLMDEGILAGDAAFIEKAEKRLDEFVDNSSILILATHSRDLLDRFCHKEIALTKGRKI